jgi:7-carboxy-7-deazaguanine synthase
MDETLLVNEIFLSIQGESTHAGRPCSFVRLTGCNLRCSYCDTEYAFHEGERMTIPQIVTQLDSYGCDLIEITGGEPLIQLPVYGLINELLGRGRTVMIETSGASDVRRVNPRAIKIMDLKCPDSGESDRNRWENLEHLTARDEIKFVISSRRDYEWAREVIRERNLAHRVNAILMSPAWHKPEELSEGQSPMKLEPAALASWILEDRIPARLQLQMHKHIWGAAARGV